ncbi:MAG: purine-nucleoside phosphorylase [Deltaproteobacteria bacterium]|nr:purine-nucleoside phosphorylase [Deltaproteobacteria bacterium]
MKSFKDKVLEAAYFVHSRIETTPGIGLLLGTGLGRAAESLQNLKAVSYSEIPNFPVSTAPGHHGRLLCGEINGKRVLAMQGRFHYYEGYSMKEVTIPIRVMQVLGIKTFILTNAAGGINPLFNTGDIMLIVDHINLTGDNPLIGPNIDEWGPRFPDMSRVYDRNLMALAREAALRESVRLQEGVYVGLAGPSLETPAEIRFLRTIGADAVGLSTVAEIIAAAHAGMAILAFSVITNMNLPDNPQPARFEDIINAAGHAAPRLQAIIERVISSQEPGDSSQESAGSGQFEK